MSAERRYVRVDEHGVMRIGNSRVRTRCTPTSNSKTSCGRHGAPRARPGRAPSLSVCEPCGHQRLPSAHESQEGGFYPPQRSSGWP